MELPFQLRYYKRAEDDNGTQYDCILLQTRECSYIRLQARDGEIDIHPGEVRTGTVLNVDNPVAILIFLFLSRDRSIEWDIEIEEEIERRFNDSSKVD